MKISSEDVEDIALGASLLGTGGGGDPYIGRLITQSALSEYGPPTVLDMAELDDDAVVYSIAGYGAPTVQIEKLINGDEVEFALTKLEDFTGHKADALLPAEIGGGNSLLPVMLAARRGISVINGDGMGRAFPELQMNCLSIMGIKATPLVVVDEHLNYAIIEADDDKTAEDLTRSLAIRMGLRVFIACFPMTGRDVKKAAIPGTLGIALEIGRTLREGRGTDDVITRLFNYLTSSNYYNKPQVLFIGKIVDVYRETSQGFSSGSCKLVDLNDTGRTAVIRFQNENLVVKVADKTAAIVPDLICILDSETGEPILTPNLRYGQRVIVIGLNAPPQLRTSDALSTFGPQCFGIDEPYIPLS